MQLLANLTRLLIAFLAILGLNLHGLLRWGGMPSGRPSWSGLVGKLKGSKQTLADWMRRL